MVSEQFLAVQVVWDTERHIVTTEPVVLSLSLAVGLWVFTSQEQEVIAEILSAEEKEKR